ncbi:unnamed protein product [Microthlaspi erraticum]|uniref:Receptor-like serine/threonine-protein kinase n=1 Tax=Microthlaspi erraticum TaxID=1685480 RepID=A0A6D2I3R6_9BRAS|nr:unnamed protein product [Microthlaspi erraticum]
MSPLILVLSLSCFLSSVSLAQERAFFSGDLSDSQTIVSGFRTFRFGFFSPVNSSSRYAGIWYNGIPEQTVIWVANKDKPINDSSAVISVSEDGNLVVTDGQRRVLWSTNFTTQVRGNSTVVELLDSGNLVLKDVNTNAYLWESFKHPTDSWLPNMLVETNTRTGGRSITITSWKTPSDPSPGSYTAALILSAYPELYIFNNKKNNATVWRSGPWNGQMFNGLPDKYAGVFLYKFMVNHDTDGSVTMSYANDSTLRYFYLDYRGYVIRRDWSEVERKWMVGDQVPATECDIYRRCGEFASCDHRKTRPCSCIRGFMPRNLMEWNNGNWSGGCIRKVPLQCERQNSNGSADGFLRLRRMKLPDFARRSEASEPECLRTCLQTCSCIACAHGLGYGCMIWNGSLVDSQELSASEMDLHGKLQDGQEIAVKRLSRASGQGLEELVNEVVVISKLQHRNLVKLLGCCIAGEERMLVYEFMPNKSLDYYLFDPTKAKLLDWKTRFSIINGICRGLLYLHRDSRLRIIHRDLKASNILLDENMIPKISDFGLAKIFTGSEDEANTRRVVGTYGYMSPEYAMRGRFSEKSDVFSLGVILLEFVSGRRNSNSTLLPDAWSIWNEGEINALVDPEIFDPLFEREIQKCVHIGLLCVQEAAYNRPSVATVCSMLSSEIADIPQPKQHAFISRNGVSEAESNENSELKASINGVTITDVSGR